MAYFGEGWENWEQKLYLDKQREEINRREKMYKLEKCREKTYKLEKERLTTYKKSKTLPTMNAYYEIDEDCKVINLGRHPTMGAAYEMASEKCRLVVTWDNLLILKMNAVVALNAP